MFLSQSPKSGQFNSDHIGTTKILINLYKSQSPKSGQFNSDKKITLNTCYPVMSQSPKSGQFNSDKIEKTSQKKSVESLNPLNRVNSILIKHKKNQLKKTLQVSIP